MKQSFINSAYNNPVLIIILLLGFVSGLPLSLVFSTLSVWLAEVGVSKTSIGLFATVSTPYAIKFLWAPLIDNFKVPYLNKILGRRRSWIIATQILLIISLFALGLTDPSINPLYTALCAIIVAFASASQDIVIDAYRVEVLKKQEQGAGAAVAVFGYRVGMLVSSAGALFLAYYFGWMITYFIMGLLILIGIITTLIAKRPNIISSINSCEKSNTKDWLLNAVVNPFVEFFNRNGTKGAIIILAFIVLYKFGDAFAGVMTNVFLIDIGFNKVEIASIVKTFGFFATIIGGFIGGYIVGRIGMIKSLWVCGIIQMLSNLVFVVQAKLGHDVGFLAVTIGVENFSSGLGTTAFLAYLAHLCNVKYTATQYALFTSLAAFGRTWLSASSGWFADNMSWELFFSLSAVVAIPGLLMLILLKSIEFNKANSA